MSRAGADAKDQKLSAKQAEEATLAASKSGNVSGQQIWQR